MYYSDTTHQIAEIEQQTQNLAQNISSQTPDPATGKEWALDLK